MARKPAGRNDLTSTPPGIGDGRKATKWQRGRLNLEVSIAAVVVIAIVCVLITALSSARRADEVAMTNERHLLFHAIDSRSDWSRRKLDDVVPNDGPPLAAGDSVGWLQNRIRQSPMTVLNVDYIVLADSDGRFSKVMANAAADATRDAALPELLPIRDFMSAAGPLPNGIALLGADAPEWRRTLARGSAFLLMIHGDLTIATAKIITPPENADLPSDRRPVFIGATIVSPSLLANIANRLQLPNLRLVAIDGADNRDHALDFVDGQGEPIARLAWTPQRPGAEVVGSVAPYVAVAIIGFALLAVLVIRNLRRTEAAIEAGEHRLRHLALHDSLCGLPNRNFFSERLETVIREVRDGASTPAAVLYIDLDHFKDVNDTLGHPVGDELIRWVTTRLKTELPDSELVARVGGDEFAVITRADADAAQAIADQLIPALCAPYLIGNHTVVIGASIGIAILHPRIGAAADVMRYADMALYRAKNEGRNRACIYDKAMDADLVKRKLIENDLRAAIERDALHVAYQPIVSNNGETVIGVEALCRWTHPERGDIPPSEFIPIAEYSGLIIPLGEWVLRRACLDAKAWPGVFMAVNVSPLQFRRPNFVGIVERILAETGFDPTRLELEVTESTLFGNFETAGQAMAKLKALGVRLALDDFGTGYSSLLYLRRFPFDKLKIDRSFVHSIERADAAAAAIVHAVVGLGRGLGMKVTAEGVETADQQLFLRAAGIHSMQGYRFGRPAAADQIAHRLAFPASFQIQDETDGLAVAI
jgi:diguanylate cyclase (GGDEF)-like protein